MSRQEILINQDLMYALTRDDEGNLFIEVVCGGFAMETIVIPISAEEESEYRRHGRSFLDGFSLKICKSLDTFRERCVTEDENCCANG